MTEAAIAGIGHTQFSMSSGKSERELAIEAVRVAVRDAGLDLAEIDGLVTYDLDSNDPITLAAELSLGELSWYSRTPYGGGGACATVQDALLAVQAGLAEVIVVYRAANLRSGQRFGQGDAELPPAQLQWSDWSRHVGLVTPAHMFALSARRYLHERGFTAEDLVHIVLASRRYAASNPLSRFFGKTYSKEEYLAAPWVVEPVLRVPDCCLENDGGAALVITRSERAVHGGGAVAIRAAARGVSRGSRIMQNYFRDEESCLPDLRVALRQLWRQSGLRPGDIDAAIVYDAFSPYVYMALEELGQVAPADVVDFVAAGGVDREGDLPINPNGGQLGEAYLHGFNGLLEAVRQARGVASNQIANVEHVLVTGGPSLATSALVLAPT